LRVGVVPANEENNVNEKSELTVDVEASIAKAYDTALPTQEQESVRRHLAFILPKSKEPNTLIAPVQAALMAIQSRPVVKQWHEHAVAKVIGGVLLALVIAGLTKLLGWN
jgi:hypothetical protein